VISYRCLKPPSLEVSSLCFFKRVNLHRYGEALLVAAAEKEAQITENYARHLAASMPPMAPMISPGGYLGGYPYGGVSPLGLRTTRGAGVGSGGAWRAMSAEEAAAAEAPELKDLSATISRDLDESLRRVRNALEHGAGGDAAERPAAAVAAGAGASAGASAAGPEPTSTAAATAAGAASHAHPHAAHASHTSHTSHTSHGYTLMAQTVAPAVHTTRGGYPYPAMATPAYAHAAGRAGAGVGTGAGVGVGAGAGHHHHHQGYPGEAVQVECSLTHSLKAPGFNH
jgi:hypothetical protein